MAQRQTVLTGFLFGGASADLAVVHIDENSERRLRIYTFDLVVPDADGFWVFIQRSDGAYTDPVKLGPAFEIGKIYETDGYRYNP